ncbi:unnamed protein product [Symbiodinium necroappetens]|uniref:Uncharacterized protein n=1 Tax=Symbiodinium necroappetens TaxID=1628268 RepID=A0A812R4Q9_9DINO|nr:unnamed protein product [Symbiodinium necroappetens]
MPTPSQFPALQPSELQDRLRLAKTQFDENVETLHEEFERVLSQAHECVRFFDTAARDALSANVDDPSCGTSLRNYGDANVKDTAHKVACPGWCATQPVEVTSGHCCRAHNAKRWRIDWCSGQNLRFRVSKDLQTHGGGL